MKLTVRLGNPTARRRARAVQEGERLLPRDGDVEGLVMAVARHRSRSIQLLPYPLDPSGPSGFWIGTPTTDYIVHAAGSSPTRRAAVVCHEVAHMLLGHEPEAGVGDGAATARLLAPDVDREVAARFLSRHAYEAGLEADAEAVATALVAEAARRQQAASSQSDRVSTRLR